MRSMPAHSFLPDGRVRRAGAGRPRVGAVDAGLVPALNRLVDPATRGDPRAGQRAGIGGGSASRHTSNRSSAPAAGGRCNSPSICDPTTTSAPAPTPSSPGCAPAPCPATGPGPTPTSVSSNDGPTPANPADQASRHSAPLAPLPYGAYASSPDSTGPQSPKHSHRPSSRRSGRTSAGHSRVCPAHASPPGIAATVIDGPVDDDFSSTGPSGVALGVALAEAPHAPVPCEGKKR